MKPKCTFCALALLFAGCGSDDFSGPDRPGVDLAVEAAIEVEQVAIKQQWGMGDQIGVSVVGMDDYAVDTKSPMNLMMQPAALFRPKAPSI